MPSRSSMTYPVTLRSHDRDPLGLRRMLTIGLKWPIPSLDVGCHRDSMVEAGLPLQCRFTGLVSFSVPLVSSGLD